MLFTELSHLENQMTNKLQSLVLWAVALVALNSCDDFQEKKNRSFQSPTIDQQIGDILRQPNGRWVAVDPNTKERVYIEKNKPGEIQWQNSRWQKGKRARHNYVIQWSI